jgi:hypothetical protein
MEVVLQTVWRWFGTLNTIAGYEAMNIIRKGQIRRLAKGDIVWVKAKKEFFKL